MKVQSLRVIITKADNCSGSKNWIIFSFFPRTSYLLNFVEYCLSCVSYKQMCGVWKTLWMALLMAFSSSLPKIISTSPIFCLMWEKKGFKVTFVKEHNWAQENLEVLWLSFDNMLILVCEGGDEAGSLIESFVYANSTATLSSAVFTCFEYIFF